MRFLPILALVFGVTLITIDSADAQRRCGYGTVYHRGGMTIVNYGPCDRRVRQHRPSYGAPSVGHRVRGQYSHGYAAERRYVIHKRTRTIRTRRTSRPPAYRGPSARPLNRPYVPPPTFTENGIRYTGRACQRGDGSTGREGYRGQTIGCWRF